MRVAINQQSIRSLSAEDATLFETFGAGSSTTVPFACIHHAFEYHAQRSPDAVAIEHLSKGEMITYADLDRKANRMAKRLRALGVFPKDRVCILSKRSIAHAVSVLAILKAGAQYVPIDGETVSDRALQHVVTDSGAVLLLHMEAFLRPAVDIRCELIESIIAMDEMRGSRCNKMLDSTRGSDGAYLIYTSGTTGLPKGVDVRHSGVTNLLLQAPGNTGMRPGMRVSQLLNIAFDMGAWELLGALGNGCTLCLRGDRSHDWRAVLRSVDIVISTPAILDRHHPADYPNIKHVVVAGEACPQPLADLWASYTNFSNSYGPTEITVVTTFHKHTPGDQITIGRPIPNSSVYILDDDCQPLPIGEIGWMWVGGAGVANGYLNLPEKTAEKFKVDPFLTTGGKMYNTGDLCRWTKDGKLEFLGRADDQVKIKGFRVELDGVTAAMRTCPTVTQACALLVDNELWGFFSPSSVPLDQIQAAASSILPSYAVPTKYLPMTELPVNRNGKLDRSLLKSLAEEQYSEASFGSPQTPNLSTPDYATIFENASTVSSVDFPSSKKSSPSSRSDPFVSSIVVN